MTSRSLNFGAQLSGDYIRRQLSDIKHAFAHGSPAMIKLAVFDEAHRHKFVIERTGRARELPSRASAGGGTFTFQLEPAHNGLLKFTAYWPRTGKVYKTGTLFRVYEL